MSRRSWAALGLAALAAACGHVRYKVKGRPVPYQGWFATFPSGMRLVVYELPQVDRFILSVSYRAGSVDDPAGKEGLAHLVEHLAFRARPDGSGSARIWDRLLATGWGFNAYTSADHTAYWEVGKPPDLRAALALEAARMRDPLAGVSEDDFAVERDVVLSEYRERFQTDPTGSELRFLIEAAFPDGHPYGRTAAGDATSIRRMTLPDARAFVKTRYQPAGAVLVVASPLPGREIEGMVVSAFGAFAENEGVRVQPLEWKPPGLPPPPESERPLVERRAPVEQPHLWVAWTAPGFHARRTPQAHAAALALDLALSRKFTAEAYNQNVDGLAAFAWDLDGATLIVARVDLARAEDARRYLDLVKSAAFDLRIGGLASAEAARLVAIDATREQLLVGAYWQLEHLDTDGVARWVRATGAPDFLGFWPKLVAAQLNADIDSYAAEFMRRERAAAVLVLPDGNTLPRVAGESLPRRHDAVDELEDEELHPAPSPERVLAAAPAPGLDRVQKRTLPNGLEVVVARRGVLPLAEVRLVVRTDVDGTAAIPAGVGMLALGSHVPTYVARGQVQVGADRSQGMGREWVAFGSRGSSANLDVLLEGVAQTVRSQYVDHFKNRRRFAVRHQERLEHQPAARAMRLLEERLFPGHPYGAVPTPASVEGIAERAADRWTDAQIRPERSTLLVVSDLDPSPEMWGWIESEFGGWSRGAAVPAPLPAPAPIPRRSVVLVDRPGATQALLLVGLQGPAAHGDEPAAEAMRWTLESRLERRIRVEDGVSYGVRLTALEFRTAQALVAAAAVDGAAAGASLVYLLESVSSLAQKPLDAAAVARARWHVARRFGLRFDTVGGAAQAMQSAAAFGLPLDRYERMPESIASIDAARILAAARALSPGREVVVVVGDARAVGPQLRTAGLEPEVIR